MIASFADEKTEQVFRRRRNHELPATIQKRARDKLLVLDNAACERDLRYLPVSRLEPSAGDGTEQWMLRVNERWSLCFEWQGGSAHSVHIAARSR